MPDTAATAVMAEMQNGTRPLITISIPVFNEEDNIAPLHKALSELASRETEYDFEFLFTDNASTDRTFDLLSELSAQDRRVRVLRFSRNFGFQKSILTNYVNARGAAAVQIDADLQDPPELISEFLLAWKAGYKVVYGVRRHRQESMLLHWARRRYYALIASLSSTPLPRDAGDFRLVDRVILDHLSVVDEQTPYLRGIIASLGYAQKGIVYDRQARTAGKSKFGLFSLVELGIDGITSQSTRPLRYVTVFGLVASVLSLVLIVFYVVAWLLGANGDGRGFTTIVLMLTFLIGLNALLLGLLGEYVGRIFNNTRGLPITIVEHRLEHPDAPKGAGAHPPTGNAGQ